jgi:hypothetical protein
VNCALPPRGGPGRESGLTRIVPGAIGSVGRASHPPERKTQPGRCPAAQCVIDRNSALVGPLSALVLRGLDLDPVLLGGGGEIAPNAVTLPISYLHELSERGTLRPRDQFQDFCSLALRARSSGLRFRGFFAGLGILLRGGSLGFAFVRFRALGRALLMAGTFLRGRPLWRSVGAQCHNGGGCVGFFGSHVGLNSISARGSRTTIHRSGWQELQADSAGFTAKGEGLAMEGQGCQMIAGDNR